MQNIILCVCEVQDLMSSSKSNTVPVLTHDALSTKIEECTQSLGFHRITIMLATDWLKKSFLKVILTQHRLHTSDALYN